MKHDEYAAPPPPTPSAPFAGHSQKRNRSAYDENEVDSGSRPFKTPRLSSLGNPPVKQPSPSLDDELRAENSQLKADRVNLENSVRNLGDDIRRLKAEYEIIKDEMAELGRRVQEKAADIMRHVVHTDELSDRLAIAERVGRWYNGLPRTRPILFEWDSKIQQLRSGLHPAEEIHESIEKDDTRSPFNRLPSPPGSSGSHTPVQLESGLHPAEERHVPTKEDFTPSPFNGLPRTPILFDSDTVITKLESGHHPAEEICISIEEDFTPSPFNGMPRTPVLFGSDTVMIKLESDLVTAEEIYNGRPLTGPASKSHTMMQLKNDPHLPVEISTLEEAQKGGDAPNSTWSSSFLKPEPPTLTW